VRLSTASLMNAHLRRSPLKMKMGRLTVYVTGQVRRSAENPYKVDKKTAFLAIDSRRFRRPIFFNLMGLLDNEIEIGVGGGTFRLFVEPVVRSVLDRMASRLKIIPKDGKPGLDITLSTLVRKSYEAGHPLKIDGKDYRLFLYEELKGELQAAGTGRKTVALLTLDEEEKGEFFTFLYPMEHIPADKIRQYPLGDGKIGLRLKDGQLELHF
jgi:hypothetical protein